MIWAPATDDVGPVTVNVASQAALLADLDARFARGDGFRIATLNLDHVVKLHRDPAFRAAYGAHSHVTADGRPIVWLSRLAGQDTGLVTGSDLIAPLVALAAEREVPVALIGSTQDVLDTAAARLEAQAPGLRVVARIAPPMGFDPEGDSAADVLAEVDRSGARLCLLALGAPKQERFAAHAGGHMPHVGFVSIGAGLDFIAGVQTRAPRLVRALAAEWLWRLLGNPKRLLGRYAACFVILPGLTVQALRARLRPAKGATQ